MTLIVADKLGRTFGRGGDRVQALVDVTLEISAGEHLAIIGRSGAGKSTLLRLMGALDTGYTGSLRVDGRELRGLGDSDLSRFRNTRVGFVFQAFNLLPNLTVGANLVLPAFFSDALSESEAEKRARSLLERVGLTDKWDTAPLKLSGGERQRVAIARALLLHPPVLICDEPTGALDEETAADVLDLFEEVRAERNSTLIVVTHDHSIAARAQRTIRLDGGRLVSDDGASA